LTLYCSVGCCFPWFEKRENLYDITQHYRWPSRLVHFGPSSDLVLRRATALLTLGSCNKSFLDGLGSTIADSSTCGHYLYIIRAYGNLFVIKACFIVVSCQPNFMGCSIYALSLSGDDGISWILCFLNGHVTLSLIFVLKNFVLLQTNKVTNNKGRTWVCCSCWRQLNLSLVAAPTLLKNSSMSSFLLLVYYFCECCF